MSGYASQRQPGHRITSQCSGRVRVASYDCSRFQSPLARRVTRQRLSSVMPPAEPTSFLEGPRRWPGQLRPAFMLAAALVGAACLFFGCVNTANIIRARHWPVTEGVIRSHVVRDEVVPVADGYVSEPQAAVRFEYAVGGRQLQSDRLRFTGQAGGWRHTFSPAFAAAYPVGTSVQVAYNPADPSDAVLLPVGLPWGSATVALGGLVLLAAYARYVLRLNRAAAPSHATVA